MALNKGFSSEDAQQILQPLSNLKINQEIAQDILQPLSEINECLWDVFTGEILPRLSTKQLQTFKTVCKNWLQIISSPYFVMLHLDIYNQSQIRVLMPRFYGVMECNINSGNKQHICYPPKIGGRRNRVLGSCDGLLCLSLSESNISEYVSEIAVYNPSTRKYFKVPFRHENPHVRDFFNYSWFGRHPCSGEYLLVLVIQSTKFRFRFEVGVYKFSATNSELKLIHSTSCCTAPLLLFSIRHEIGILLHGALHWPAQFCTNTGSHRHVISAYRLDTNNYFEISPPVQDSGFKLGVAEGRLFAISASNAGGVSEMWIMKEYGVEQSWTKYAEIQGLMRRYRVLFPLGFFPNGNDLILYPNESGLVKYTFNDNKAVLLHDPGNSYEGGAIMCADSLVSPTIVEGGVQ